MIRKSIDPSKSSTLLLLLLLLQIAAMDPYLEQRLRDEVIYLHSLWHQGPPNRRNPTPIFPNPTPRPAAMPHFPYPIAAAAPKRKSTTQFETPTPNKKPFQPDPRWESPGPTRPDDSTWPQSSPQLSLAPVSEEERLRQRAVKLHARALEVCGGFFAGSGSGSESEEEEEEEDEDGENEEYKLLLKVFVEESELRKFYEGNWDEGEFYCLVCGGLGKTKKVKGCVGLVHHAISISKTKKKRAHRAFGQIVCRVLGWDFRRMPFVVLKGEKLSFYLANPGVEQAVFEVNARDREGVSGGVKDNVGDERDADAVSGGKGAIDEDVMVCQNSLDDDDANQCKDILDKGISETKEDIEEAVDTRGEPEVNADQLDNVPENNVAAENDAPAESSENEATADHQCNDKEQMICQSSLNDDGTDKSRVSLDEGNIVSINEATREEANEGLGESEVCAGSCDGVFGVKDNVAAENDGNAGLGEKEVFDDHQINSENQMICQNSLNTDESSQNTETLDKVISEVEPKKEDALDTGVEISENADDSHDLVVSKENLDIVSRYDGEIGSKEEPGAALVDGTPMASKLQAEPEKHVDSPNDDLNVFLENLEPL